MPAVVLIVHTSVAEKIKLPFFEAAENWVSTRSGSGLGRLTRMAVEVEEDEDSLGQVARRRANGRERAPLV